MAAFLVAALAAPAAAETHGAVAAGGLVRFDAPALGVWAAAELWPGGLLGARVDLVATGGPVLVVASLARALGATWRHLVVAVPAGAGADLDRRGVAVAGGVTAELGLGIGPLALATDLTLHVVVWDGRSDRIATGALGLEAAF